MAGSSWVLLTLCFVAFTHAASPTVRLTNGGIGYGILEVYDGTQWGTVCEGVENIFTNVDAEVVCRQLGFLTGEFVADSSGDDNLPILLNNIVCDGTEASILDCQNDGWNNIGDSCDHTRDVGIDCRKSVLPGRLVGGADAHSGRLELQLEGAWGTVDGTGFTAVDALVACAGNLGFGSGNAVATGTYPAGTGSIWLANVVCNGSESGIGMCQHDAWDVSSTSDHANDVGLTCGTALQTRIVNPEDPSNTKVGRLEVQLNGVWGGVCTGIYTRHPLETFDNNAARAACTGMGMPYGGRVIAGDNIYGESDPEPGQVFPAMFLTNVNCTGTESNIGFCRQNIFNTTDLLCNYRFASIDCNLLIEDIQLVGGTSTPTLISGLLEIQLAQQWGAVCSAGFSDVEASIACNMMGWPDGVVTRGSFTGSDTYAWTNHVNCTGDENSLNDCLHDEFVNTTVCDSADYVKITCYKTDFAVRLGDDGLTTGFGRLEVFKNGKWGSVCSLDKGTAFTDLDATVACRGMGRGFHSGVVIYDYPTSSTNTEPIWMSGVSCVGNEDNLGDCDADTTVDADCEHENDVAIACITTRLMDGGVGYGRLEVYHEGEWGTVCEIDFEDTDAEVVCRTLGFVPVGVHIDDVYGDVSDGPIWLGEVACNGTEYDISFCDHSKWGEAEYCTHDKDVGIDCTKAVLPTRLADGNTTSGRLEVQIGEEWGTVCNTHFSEREALVACVENLGFGTGSLAVAGTYTLGDVQTIELSGVDCGRYDLVNDYGGIGMCAHDPWQPTTCDHTQDVGLNCGAVLVTRLNDGVDTNAARGVLEVSLDGGSTFKTVCSAGFTREAAIVVCRSLGDNNRNLFYPRVIDAGEFDASLLQTPNLTGIACVGTEDNIGLCPQHLFGKVDFQCDGEYRSVAVDCQIDIEDTRLVGGATPNEGTIEIEVEDQWGNVCDTSKTFSTTAAQVVCAYLGYSGGVSQSFGNRTQDSIWLDDVECTGGEDNIGNCGHLTPFGKHSCQLSDMVVGVICGEPLQTRLSGGVDGIGRLEVRLNSTGDWSTVCSTGFTDVEAEVACRGLGAMYCYGGSVIDNSFGDGPAAIFTNVQCGDSTLPNIGYCMHTPYGVTDCSDGPVALNCVPQITATRLSGGSPSKGIVEVQIDGQWGTVCHNGFSNASAVVVCNSIGYSHGYVTVAPEIAPATANIFLDNVYCSGTEDSLASCSHDPVGTYASNCNHNTNVIVMCDGSLGIRLGSDSTTDEVGRLEVFYNNQWGTVCSESFSDDDAYVACKLLGMSTGLALEQKNDFFGPGSGPIWLSNVACQGPETSIFDCQHDAVGTSDCNHAQDVGVDCRPYIESMVLSGGADASSGVLQITVREQIGTVCSHGFTQEAAELVCNYFGYTAAAIKSFGPGTGQIWLNNVDCVGNETSIGYCSHDAWGTSTGCTHADDVGLQCSVGPTTRVSGGGADYGRLEIFHGNSWGTICSTEFDDVDAMVACRDMGFRAGGVAIPVEQFGFGYGTVWLDEVQCVGTEKNLTECPHSGFGKSTCPHSLDVAVDCRPRLNGVRLIGGTDASIGRLEILVNSTWGTVCSTGFTPTSASVACNSIGYLEGSIVPNTYTPASTGPIWLSNVACVGDENDIGECAHDAYGLATGCDHSSDVAISCKNAMETRVAGLGGSYGRLEVYLNGAWGTVCDQGFTQFDATVACKSLGFPGGSSVAASKYGPGIGNIWLANVTCNGAETSVVSCQSITPTDKTSTCTHENDVGIECITTRLADGGADYGRVEVYADGQWGSVCDTGFGLDDALVVCSGLGFLSAAEAVNTFGNGTVAVAYDNVVCEGYESSIVQCTSTPTDTCNGALVAVDCRPYVETTRLGDGTSSSGRLEVFVNGEWGTVCSSGFNAAAANLACQNLGFINGSTVADGSFPQGAGPIWLNQVACNGSEASIGKCAHSDYGSVGTCTHANDVGIVCSGTAIATRLSGGGKDHGRVEVYNGGQWGTVCSTGFSEVEAQVVCSSLGFTVGEVVSQTVYGPGTGPIWLEDVHCRGTSESTIAECTHSAWGVTKCTHAQDVAVDCRTVRLLGGQTDAGILELYYNRTWGTVCSAGFNDVAATVACKSLGFDTGAVFTSNNLTSDDSAPVFLDKVSCKGSESSITDCTHSDWGVVNCTSANVVAVACKATIPTSTTGDGHVDTGKSNSHKSRTIALAVILPIVGVCAIAVCHHLTFFMPGLFSCLSYV